MLPSKSSKRLRSSKSSAEEPTPDNAFIPPAKRNTRSRSAPSQTQPRDNLDQESQQRFTRRRAKTLGKEPISGEEEPERYLRRKAKQQAQAAAKEPEKNSPEMDRGGQPRANPEDDDPGRHGLQGLLRRLGAGFEDVFPVGAMMGGGARIKPILAMLREDDEMQQMAGLSELCEYISISTEESMVAFPVEQIVPIVVTLLGHEHNPDLMLLAARALTFLADVYPPSSGSIIRHGAVPAFCARLLTIEYIDLAEQSLQALEKLSHEHAAQLLRAGALVAVLSYVDFFQTGVQRVAVATAANICRGLTLQHVDAVTTAAPILIGLLRYSDAKIVDSACLALTRIAEVFSKSPSHMETLCGFGLIDSIVQLVTVSESGSISSQLTSSTFYGLIKLLATCASGSHVVAESLLQGGVSRTLRTLLTTSPLLTTSGASPGNALRSADQLQGLVALATQLLPPVPDASAAVLAVTPSGDLLGDAKEEGPETVGSSSAALSAYLQQNPEVADRVASDLLPVMLRVYTASVTPQVKRQSLGALVRMVYHAPVPTLSTLLSDLPVSSLVAMLLRSSDAGVVAQGMQLAEILMGKLPEVFTKFFLKEGVVQAMEDLAATAPAAATSTPGSDGGLRTRSGRVTRSRSQVEEVAPPPAPPAEMQTPAGTTLRTALATHARRFCARYFIDDNGNPMGCKTEGMKVLEDVCARLPDPDAVRDLLSVLAATGTDSISTFELLTSGSLRALRSYLQGDDITAASDDDRHWQLLERLGSFSKAALPKGSGASPPLLVLLSKLQDALAATEKLPVHINTASPVPTFGHYFPGAAFGGRHGLSRSGGGGNGSLSAGLAALSNPFKIRLCRAGDETGLKDYGSNVVLIEPLASLVQVEDFLWPRVQMSAAEAETGAAPAAPAPAAAPAGPSAGGSSRREPSRGRPIPQPGNRRRLTRAQARALAEAEVAAQVEEDAEGASPRPEGDFMSEDLSDEHMEGAAEPEAAGLGIPIPHVHSDEEHDDDEDMEEGYVDEDYDEEEDDMLEDAAMHVHDMHLGEETGLTQSPSRSRGRRGQDAARSPPAAAAGQSGDAQRSYASAAAGGAEGAPEANAPPKLAFYLNGRLLEPGTTVFQAVQTAVGSGSSAAQASGSDMSSRLWGTIHTLSYRTYAAAQRLRSSTAGEGSGPMDMETAVVKVSGAAALPGNVAASPLGELLSPCCGTFTDAAGRDRLEGALSTDATDVLAVMCTIEALNRLTPHLLAALDGRRGRPRSASASGPPGHVPREAFISGRLGPKLSQQLKDVISICGGALPVWCGPLVTHARFLFPFEVRRRYLYCSAFGLSRALHFLQQAHSAEHGPGAAADRDAAPFRVNRVHRQKVRISRRRVLESAHRVFELYAGGKSQLEVEFFNEAGSGLGPTLEFYTLLSHEMQKRSLGMWRDEGDAPTDAATKPPQNVQAAQVPAGVVRTISGPGPLQGELHAAVHEGAAEAAAAPDIVNAPLGLFPRPLAPGDARSESGAVPKHFRLLGRVVAKALQDGRLLDLPLSPVFYRLALGHRLDLYDVREVDPALGASLERLYAAEREAAASGGKAVVDGCPVEDLFLTFVLPGDSSYELKPGGSEVPVTSANLAEYINAVVDATLGEGVAVQVEAFCAGVNGIFPISSLTPFFEDEIEAMLCGTGEAWAVGGLAEVIKFDHGYTASSPPVVALLEVLSELDPLDQRRFLRFVTGSPRLPPGGLAALTPRLTVVRKLSAAVAAAAAAGGELGTSLPGGSLASDAAGSFNQGSGPRGGNLSDGDLPSVMTCANYLKLPPYSCKEVLRERLLFAIREGQGSFDLS